MKFSDLLKNIDEGYNAFFLGMIYGWPVFDVKNKLLFAFSSYKTGSKIKRLFPDLDMDIFFNEHIKKIEDNFDVKPEDVILNSDLKKFSINNERKATPGISIKIDFDIDFGDIPVELFILGQIEKFLIDASVSAKNKFILGIMDSRGSLDFSGNFITVDIAEKEKPEIVKRKINKFHDLIGTVFNYNPRVLQKKSNGKNDQFRMKLKYFVGHYGLFTPFKIEYYKRVFLNSNQILEDGFIFKDKNFENELSKTGTLKTENLAINEFTIDINSRDISKEEKIKLIERYRFDNNLYDSDDEILYSSANIKNQAKIDAEFKCEFDEKHDTFIAKTDNNKYVEAHHLIPFAKRKEFDLSIDISENIVCLCPNCHRKIHLAIESDRRSMIENLFLKRIDLLKKAGIFSDLQTLINYYK